MKLTKILILILPLVLTFCGKTVEFSGESAYQYLLKQCEFGPRNPGSDGHKRCMQFLRDELSLYADVVNVHPFTHFDSKRNINIDMYNIIASFNMNHKGGERVLLCAHWDTRPIADRDSDPLNHSKPILGANDGASGVAVLLEIAKMLKFDPAGIGIDMIFFDGEDYGEEGSLEQYFLGSREFVKVMGNYRPVFGILLDMIGDIDLDIPIEPNSNQIARDIVDDVWDLAENLGIKELRREIGKAVISDDHIILSNAGIRSIVLIDFDYKYWHTLEDTPDKTSPESLKKVGTVVINYIYDL
ncbi:M28 family peptidase [candidate division KSB1 bacterium]